MFIKILVFVLLAATFSSCTYSIVMNHTEGTASDLVDENQNPSPTISTDVSVVPKV